jgi:hypothetical protein
MWSEVIQVHDDQLAVQVLGAPDSDAEELADLTQLLRTELLQLDVASVEPMPDEDIPEHAKGLGAVVGWLSVKLGTVDRVRSVVRAIRGWTVRTHRSVEVSIGGDVLKLDQATADQQQQIIDAWLERHAANT